MTPNIVLQENEAFGHPNYGVIRALLFMVDMNMMTALEQPQFSSRKCQVLYKRKSILCAPSMVIVFGISDKDAEGIQLRNYAG